MRRTAVVTVLLVLLVAGQALAQAPGRYRSFDRGKKWEISLQTRYITEKSIDSQGGSSIDFEDDLGWGFGLGYNLNERFNLGFRVTWRRLGYNATVVRDTDPDSTATFGGTMDSSTFVVTGNWTPLDGRFSPYLNAGAGWMGIDSNIVAGNVPGCWWDPWWGYICGNYTQTYGTSTGVYEVGVGVRYALTPDLFIRVGYEHGWTGDDTYDGADAFRVDIGGLFL